VSAPKTPNECRDHREIPQTDVAGQTRTLSVSNTASATAWAE